MEDNDNKNEAHVRGPIGAQMDADDDAGIPPMILDLGVHRAGNLDEGLLGMMGAWITDILSAMFSNTSIPVTVRGTRSEIDSFTRALSSEKRYLETFSKYGLDNPRTYKDKGKLDKAVSEFQRKTGIKWPFKG